MKYMSSALALSLLVTSIGFGRTPAPMSTPAQAPWGKMSRAERLRQLTQDPAWEALRENAKQRGGTVEVISREEVNSTVKPKVDNFLRYNGRARELSTEDQKTFRVIAEIAVRKRLVEKHCATTKYYARLGFDSDAGYAVIWWDGEKFGPVIDETIAREFDGFVANISQ